jgi:hypothetical protein
MHFASHRNFVKPASIGKVTIVKPASIGKATFSIGLFNLMAGNSLSGDRSEAIAATKSIPISTSGNCEFRNQIVVAFF